MCPSLPPSESPHAVMLGLSTGMWISQALCGVAYHGLADVLVAGARHPEEIAAATGTHADTVRRVLRALASFGIFSETEHGFALTPLSQTLLSDSPSSLRYLFMLQGAPGHWRAWGEIVKVLADGRPGTLSAYGEHVYDFLAKHPEEAEIFDRAMTAMSRVTVPAVMAVCDFSSSSVVVDIAGGQGWFLSAVLQRNAHVRGVLFDRPDVIERAMRDGPLVPFADRCRFEGGSFLNAVPGGADTYLTMRSIHSWPDDGATAILRTIAQAMTKTARLLIVDPVLGVNPRAPITDLEMLVWANGRERTREELTVLLQAAGLHLVSLIPTAGNRLSVIEARSAAG